MTDSEVIDALGGTKKVADMFEVSSTAVSNWRERGFPGRIEARIWHECKARSIKYVPPSMRSVSAA